MKTTTRMGLARGDSAIPGKEGGCALRLQSPAFAATGCSGNFFVGRTVVRENIEFVGTISFSMADMDAPLSLSNYLTVVLAIACLWSSGIHATGGVVKQWRLALPPCLAAAVALVLLAGIFNATMGHDAEWVAGAILGAAIGRTRGWLMYVEADQKRGLVRLPRAVDGLAVAFCLVVLALIDFASAALEDYVVDPQHVAAAAAFCAGYFGFRAVAMMVRAGRAPHVELYDAGSAG